MRFSIIGAGRLGGLCAGAVKAHEGWTLESGPEGAAADWVILACPPEARAALAEEALKAGAGVLCPFPPGEDEIERLVGLAEPGRLRCFCPEAFRPPVLGLAGALGGALLGRVGVVNITRKVPVQAYAGWYDGGEVPNRALLQLALPEAAATLRLLDPARRVLAVCAQSPAVSHASLTVQTQAGVVINLQAVLGGWEKPFYAHEYACEYGVADYDSRVGALTLYGGTDVERDETAAWTAALSDAAAEDGIRTRALLRLARAVLRSAQTGGMTEVEA